VQNDADFQLIDPTSLSSEDSHSGSESTVPQCTLRSAAAADAPWIAELRAAVMRPDLERLGRFDPIRVRQRFLEAFDPFVTTVIEVDGDNAGVIAARPPPTRSGSNTSILPATIRGGGSVTMSLAAYWRWIPLDCRSSSTSSRAVRRSGSM